MKQNRFGSQLQTQFCWTPVFNCHAPSPTSSYLKMVQRGIVLFPWLHCVMGTIDKYIWPVNESEGSIKMAFYCKHTHTYSNVCLFLASMHTRIPALHEVYNEMHKCFTNVLTLHTAGMNEASRSLTPHKNKHYMLHYKWQTQFLMRKVQAQTYMYFFLYFLYQRLYIMQYTLVLYY